MVRPSQISNSRDGHRWKIEERPVHLCDYLCDYLCDLCKIEIEERAVHLCDLRQIEERPVHLCDSWRHAVRAASGRRRLRAATGRSAHLKFQTPETDTVGKLKKGLSICAIHSAAAPLRGRAVILNCRILI